jgi:hypothetical protein
MRGQTTKGCLMMIRFRPTPNFEDRFEQYGKIDLFEKFLTAKDNISNLI